MGTRATIRIIGLCLFLGTIPVIFALLKGGYRSWGYTIVVALNFAGGYALVMGREPVALLIK